MTPERWAAVEHVFLAASARPAGERAGFVAEACAGDSALQREVQSLLDEATSPTLEQSPLAALAEAMRDTSGHDRRGTLIGGYQLAERIGAGGMGEVYRARDTRLGRDVAIKILPAVFTSDHDRQQRFEREARVLASLNHPNIAALYGFAEQPATESEPELKALVLELVAGETLAARIERSTMPLDNALTVARQIADALEAAHAKGIVHRDLKPANVVIADSGLVKVLDFGLAKPMAPAGGDAERPPPSGIGSREGAIIGTAAYMSPEQARGLPVDTRSDIWAFGCVLYEMLTGQQAFRGQTASDTIAAILGREADWSALPPGTPASVIQLLRRCLEKDLKRRLHHIADARIDIDDVLDGQTAVSAFVTGRDRRAARLPWLVATISLLAALAAVGMAISFGSVPANGRPSRTVLTGLGAPPPFLGDDRSVAITPDATRVVYIGGEGRQLFVRRLDELVPKEIVKTAAPLNWVFISPNGEWVGFVEGAMLKKVPIGGGPVTTLAFPTSAGGATWAADDTIIFGADEGANLQSIPSSGSGGAPTVLTRPDVERGERHAWPEILPGGHAVLYTIFPAAGGLDAAQVAVLDLKTLTSKVLVHRARHAQYVPSGHLVFVSGTSLSAVSFDLDRLEAGRMPVTVVPRLVTHRQGAGEFVIAADGTLAYVDAPAGTIAPRRSLVWVDRQGQEKPLQVQQGAYEQLRLSPDGGQVALTLDGNISVLDLERLTVNPRTFESVRNALFPVWTDDSRQLFYMVSGRDRMLFHRTADGSGPVDAIDLASVSSGASLNGSWIPSSVTPDGKHLIFSVGPRDFMKLALDDSRRVDVLLQTPFNERRGVVSPGGHWIAYESDSSGQFEIYVRPFPDVQSGEQHQVSYGGGHDPRWTRNGGEIVYEAPGGTIMAVAAEPEGRIWKTGTARPAFGGLKATIWDVSSDGRRVLVAKDTPSKDGGEPIIVVVANWLDELKHLGPTD